MNAVAYEALINAVEGLSEESLMDILTYVDFVKYRTRLSLNAEAYHRTHKKRSIGLMKGKIHMADDFDDIPAGFEEYMK